MENLILVGASSLARETLTAVRAGGRYRAIGFIDDNESRWGTTVNELPVLGPIPHILEYPKARLVVCVRSGQARSRLVARLRMLGVPDEQYATVVHPSASVPANCRIGQGSIVFAGVAMTAEVYLGRHVVVMPNVSLLHKSRVQSYATIGAGAAIGPSVRIGEECTIGMNSTVRDRVSIGRRAETGLGSLVLRDLPAGDGRLETPQTPFDTQAPFRREDINV
jgi:sugar O-acyltransferase (sialic acid O-acetyltransferase NeuD family)